MDKNQERFFLEKFLELRPELGLADIRDSEAPDFLARCGSAEVGIEVVQFVFPHQGGISPQAVQNYRDQFTGLLRRCHTERGIPPVTVSVHLDRVEPLMNKESRTRLAERLLDFVAGRIPSEDAQVEYDWDGIPPDIFEAGVSHLAILRHRNLTAPFWTQPHSGFLPESTGALVQEVIDRKSRSRAAYRAKAVQHWLVIVSGSQGLHSIIDFDRDVLTTEYDAAFERVFIFRTFGPSVHELKLQGVRPALR